jgi:hypothetical protein
MFVLNIMLILGMFVIVLIFTRRIRRNYPECSNYVIFIVFIAIIFTIISYALIALQVCKLAQVDCLF